MQKRPCSFFLPQLGKQGFKHVLESPPPPPPPQISADSEQLGKSLRNSHIGPACTEPLKCTVNCRHSPIEAHTVAAPGIEPLDVAMEMSVEAWESKSVGQFIEEFLVSSPLTVVLMCLM